MSKPSLHKRTGALDWNGLRTILAVARAGSLAAAARELQVRHSTVFRRIENAEKRLGERLFERSRTGWLPNAQGEAVARAAADMETAALGAERAIQGADQRITGVIRLATSELLAAYLLPPLLARFLTAHTGIEIEVDVANRNVDLTRREADLAFRATLQPPEMLVGRRVAGIRYAVYAAKTILGRRRKAPLLTQLAWIGFDERIAHFQIARWFRTAMPDAQPRLRLDSIAALLKAAAFGRGAAVLPMFAGSSEPALVRITPPITGVEMGLWLLNHPDVRGNARVRELSAYLAEAVPVELARLAAGGAVARPLLPCPRLKQGSDSRLASD